MVSSALTFPVPEAEVTGMELHVAKSGSDTAAGTAEAPLLTIGAAAALAQPGDTVVVHEGV